MVVLPIDDIYFVNLAILTIGWWNLEGADGVILLLIVPPQHFAPIRGGVHPISILPLFVSCCFRDYSGYGTSRIFNIDRVLSTSIEHRRAPPKSLPIAASEVEPPVRAIIVDEQFCGPLTAPVPTPAAIPAAFKSSITDTIHRPGFIAVDLITGWQTNWISLGGLTPTMVDASIS